MRPNNSPLTSDGDFHNPVDPDFGQHASLYIKVQDEKADHSSD
jgi:hypothetical protein